jgi:hypothetical protein
MHLKKGKEKILIAQIGNLIVYGVIEGDGDSIDKIDEFKKKYNI